VVRVHAFSRIHHMPRLSLLLEIRILIPQAPKPALLRVLGFASGSSWWCSDRLHLLYISHIIQRTPHNPSSEPRNRASAKALAVARREKEASREKTRVITRVLPAEFFLLFRVSCHLEARIAQLLRCVRSPATAALRSAVPRFYIFLLMFCLRRFSTYFAIASTSWNYGPMKVTSRHSAVSASPSSSSSWRWRRSRHGSHSWYG